MGHQSLKGTIYEMFFQVGIPMGTNSATFLVDLFLYSYEAYFIQGLLKNNEKKVNCFPFSLFTFRRHVVIQRRKGHVHVYIPETMTDVTHANNTAVTSKQLTVSSLNLF
jgi:hypothetical protein